AGTGRGFLEDHSQHAVFQRLEDHVAVAQVFQLDGAAQQAVQLLGSAIHQRKKVPCAHFHYLNYNAVRLGGEKRQHNQKDLRYEVARGDEMGKGRILSGNVASVQIAPHYVTFSRPAVWNLTRIGHSRASQAESCGLVRGSKTERPAGFSATIAACPPTWVGNRFSRGAPWISSKPSKSRS